MADALGDRLELLVVAHQHDLGAQSFGLGDEARELAAHRANLRLNQSMSPARRGSRGDGFFRTRLHPGVDWKPTTFVYSDCGVAQIHARTFAGQVEYRCPACAAITNAAPKAQRISQQSVAAGRGERSQYGYSNPF